MSHLLPFLSQCDMGHALTDSSSSHFPTSSELNPLHSSSSDKGDCTHPASNTIPVGPAVAKRLREERERDPTHTISPTDSSSPPIATLHLCWDKVGAISLSTDPQGIYGTFSSPYQHHQESYEIQKALQYQYSP